MIFDAALSRETLIGASFLILLFSSTAGVIVSAARALILDNIYIKSSNIKAEFNWSSLTISSKYEAFKGSIENKYRFAQSYGNMFLSVVFLFILKCAFTTIRIQTQWPILLIMLITIAILFFSYIFSLNETYKTINEILEGKPESINSNP